MSRPALAIVIPVGVTVFVVLILFLFSRILLLIGDNISRAISTGLALVTALVILGVSALLTRGGSSSSG